MGIKREEQYHHIWVLVVGGSIRAALIMPHAWVESLGIQQPFHSHASLESSEGGLDPDNESDLLRVLHVLPRGVEVICLYIVRIDVLL